MAYSRGTTFDDGTRDVSGIAYGYPGSIRLSDDFSPSRTYNSLSMAVPIHTVRRRMDDDIESEPIGRTNIPNQQSQYSYQNGQHTSSGQQHSRTPTNQIPRSISLKTHDSCDNGTQTSSVPASSKIGTNVPQQYSTTVTTTTRSNESTVPETNRSIDSSTEPFTKLQKVNFTKSLSNDSSPAESVQRTEKPQGYFNSTVSEVTRAPYSPNKRPIGATDLDQAQTKADRITDDHQAIQQLARSLQGHNSAATKESKRLPSQSNGLRINTTITTTTTTAPSGVMLVDQTNKNPKSNFSVLDAVADNPLGSTDQKQNKVLRARSNSILSAIRNSEYMSLFKKSTKGKQYNSTTDDDDNNPLPNRQGKVTRSTSNSSGQMPVLNSKLKKKSDKENNKRNKAKSQNLTKNAEFQAIDAIVGNPTSVQLPDNYLSKYRNSPSPSSPRLPTSLSVKPVNNGTSTVPQESNDVKNDAINELIKIVHEIMLHATALTISSIKSQNETAKQAKPRTITEIVLQKYATNSNQPDVKTKQEPIKPEPRNQTIDEKRPSPVIPTTPSSPVDRTTFEQSRQDPSRYIAQTISYERPIIRDEEHRSRLSQHEQNMISQNQPQALTTVNREEIEMRDKRTPKLSEQPLPINQDVRRSMEYEYPNRNSAQHHCFHHHSSPQNVKLSWLPLNNESEPSYTRNNSCYYDTDSTIYDYSPNHYSHDNAPNHPQAHYNERSYQYNAGCHQQHLPGCIYHSPSRSVFHHEQRHSPECVHQTHQRNYIEVFRDGSSRPSEIFTVPLSQVLLADDPVTEYEEYDVNRYGEKKNPTSTPNLLNDYHKVEKMEKNIGPLSSSSLLDDQCKREVETDKRTTLPLSTPNLLEEKAKSEPDKKNSLPLSSPNLLTDEDDTIKAEKNPYQLSSSTTFTCPIDEVTIIEENIPSLMPNTLYDKNIPSSSSFIYEPHFTSSSMMRDNLYSDNHLSHSKSFDYRPLRAKLQRENAVASTLLVDEWDNPERESSTGSYRYRNASSASEFY